MNNEYEIAFDRIKEEMKLRKITANTLAKKTNINVSLVEQEEMSLPSFKNMKRFLLSKQLKRSLKLSVMKISN